MRRGRLWVGAVAAAVVSLSGTVAASGPVALAAPGGVTASGLVAAADDVAGAVHVLPARRVLDTRSGLGAAAGARPGGSTTTVTVLGNGGVPASEVGAVVLHVTATGATGAGYVTAHAGGAAPPTASTLNVTAGDDVTNMTVVPVGVGGTVALRYTGSGTVHLAADVAGWVGAGAPTEPGMTGTLTSARLMDTRTGLGGRTGALTSGGLAHLQVTGRGGVPAAVGSVTLNVTVVTPSAAGSLAVTPVDPGTAQAATSSVSFATGRTTSNAVVSAVSPSGSVDLRLSTGTSAHVVVDVLAWTAPGASSATGAIEAAQPKRLLDTRTWGRSLAAGEVVTLPAPAGAVVLNVTAVGAPRAGAVIAASSADGTPGVVQLSFPARSPRSALLPVPGAFGGSVRLTVTEATALVVDEVAVVHQPRLGATAPPAVTDLRVANGPLGVEVSWTLPAGATRAVVRRSTDGPVDSPYMGLERSDRQVGGASFTDTGLAPGVRYGYAVFAVDAGGNASSASSGSTATPELSWVDGGLVSPFRGDPTDVSCPTTTWCMAVDRSGQALTYNGSTWSAPTMVAPVDGSASGAGFESVSCTSPQYCLGTLGGHRVAEWSDGAWKVVAVDRAYLDVSCWAARSCGLVEGGEASSWVDRWVEGRIASSGHVGSQSLPSISCPTNACWVLGYSDSTGSTVSLSAPSWMRTSRLPGGGPGGVIACVSTTSCMVVSSSQYWTLTAAGWSRARTIRASSGQELVANSLDCSSARRCVAVGYAVYGGGAASAHWDGSTWTMHAMSRTDRVVRPVDCASSTMCVVVDERGKYTRWNGTSWGARASFDTSRGGVRDLSCATGTSCVATDGWGNALTWSGGASWPRAAISEYVSDLDCVGSWCLALDSEGGTWRTRSNGVWSASASARVVGPSVYCASSRRCFSVDHDHVMAFTGSGWQAATRLPVDLGEGSEVSGDCPTSAFCLLVGRGGRAVSWNGSTWASRGSAPEVMGSVAVDCTSGTFCMVAGEARAAVFTGTTWQPAGAVSGTPHSLTCASSSRCYSLYYGGLSAWDGTSWAQSGSPFPWTNDGMQISCTSATACVAILRDRVWYAS